MKIAICTQDIAYFTKGKHYEVTLIDKDGDVWVKSDDQGDPMFMYPKECEVVDDQSN